MITRATMILFGKPYLHMLMYIENKTSLCSVLIKPISKSQAGDRAQKHNLITWAQKPSAQPLWAVTEHKNFSY